MNCPCPVFRHLSPALFAPLLGLLLAMVPAYAQEAPTPSPAPAAGIPAPLPPEPLKAGALVLPLWPPGSPMLRPNMPNFQTPENLITSPWSPDRIRQVTNVNNPSIEIHRADPAFNTSSAVILAPGGGDTELEAAGEGYDLVSFFYHLGVNSVILRYRLRPYSQADANADAIRAIRLVRAHAQEWNIDPKRIGLMGFSAGGERVFYVLEHFDGGDPMAIDPVDRFSSRPDFIGAIYPSGPVTAVASNAPPTFFVVSAEDASHARSTMSMVGTMVNAGVKFVEFHLYPYGEHGDGMKDRFGNPLGTWQLRFIDWFRDLGFLQKPGLPTKVDALSQQGPVSAPMRPGAGAGATTP